MEKSKLNIDWAMIVDVLAAEYGWTIDYIKTLTLPQLIILIKSIKARYARQEESIKNNQNNEENSEQELPLSHFELLGKTTVREDGTKEIVI